MKMSTFVPPDSSSHTSNNPFSLTSPSNNSLDISLTKKEELASTFGSQICLSFSSKAPKRKRFKKVKDSLRTEEAEERDGEVYPMVRVMAKSVSKSNIWEVKMK